MGKENQVWNMFGPIADKRPAPHLLMKYAFHDEKDAVHYWIGSSESYVYHILADKTVIMADWPTWDVDTLIYIGSNEKIKEVMLHLFRYGMAHSTIDLPEFLDKYDIGEDSGNWRRYDESSDPK